MKTELLTVAETQRLSKLSGDVEKPAERQQPSVDTSSPEFTHVLMRSFTKARNAAIEENAALLEKESGAASR